MSVTAAKIFSFQRNLQIVAIRKINNTDYFELLLFGGMINSLHEAALWFNDTTALKATRIAQLLNEWIVCMCGRFFTRGYNLPLPRFFGASCSISVTTYKVFCYYRKNFRTLPKAWSNSSLDKILLKNFSYF